MTESWPAEDTAADDTLLTVLDLVRSHGVRTRPDLVRASGLGRNVVTARLQQLLDAGLVAEGTLGRSTGGRAPRKLAFRHDAGHVLVAALGATGASIALAELDGHFVETRQLTLDVTCGPDRVLEEVDTHFRSLRLRFPDLPVWGIGVGVPGPVEWSSGRPVAPPIMPGWDGFDVRGFFESRHQAPVWVDNDVNLMAIGERRRGMAQSVQDFVHIKVGTGIGAGIVSGGRLHRGAQGSAGDIGHIAVTSDRKVRCRCGQTNCLEALAGGAALSRDATAAAQTDAITTYLSTLLASDPLTVQEIAQAAARGDQVSVNLLNDSARMLGQTVARIVNFFNPALIVLGGSVTETGPAYLATVRAEVLGRSLPLATRTLRIEQSSLGHRSELLGGAFLVVDELMSKDLLGKWIEVRRPNGLINDPARVAASG